MEYGAYKSFRKSKVGVPDIGAVDPGDDGGSNPPACSVESSRQSDWVCFFKSKSVGGALRSVKKEQARWEKWDGVRRPLVKSDVRREQEKGGVWVDAGTKLGRVGGQKILIKAASGASRESSLLASAWGGKGALRAMLRCGFSVQ